MDAPRVSVVVPNYDGEAWLPELLAGLAGQSYRSFETIVVDNGSADGSVGLLEAAPAVRLLALGSNTGFTGAVNRGITAASGEYLLLLNNDMAPRPDFLAALVAAADAEPEVGSFACRVLQRDDPGRIDSAGDRLAPSGRAHGIGRDQPDGAAFAEPRFVFGGTGGAVLYRRRVLDEIGGFDDDFFLYVEDTDVSFRAQLAGWRCRYVPDAVTVHRGSASLEGRGDVRARYCLRNYLYFLLKDHPLRWTVRHLPAVLGQVAREVGFAFTATRVNHGGLVALARIAATLAAVVWRTPRMLWRRLRLVRRVSLERLEADFR